ncbi:MAG: alpha/beta hydrolase [Thiolinea sp.]
MTDSTLLLIPGLLCDGTVWEPLRQRLKGKVVVADLSSQNHLTTMAEDQLTRCAGPLIVIGHSMGARVAMEMARLAPERVERLVLMDTGIHPLAEGETEKRQRMIRLAHEQGMQALADQWLPGMVAEPNRRNTELMQTLTAMVLSKNADLHERQITALINRPNAAAYLPDIRCPTLLVVGRDDQWSPVGQHEDMQRLLPDATLEIIDGAGHFAPLERAERVCQVVESWIYSA